MRKILFIFLSFLIFLPLSQTRAQGLVPCSGADCDFCDFFVLINNIVAYVFKYLVPTVAVLMLIIGGVLFLFAGARPETLNRAKGIITSVVIGLLIIFAAWVIVNTIFDKIGVINMPSGWNWWRIGCQ